MRNLIVLILGAGLCAFAAAPDLSSVRKVYLMPMGGGLDQYLAERITREGPFTVVVDPKQADAVLSEQVGPAFEEQLKDLYPPPKVAAEKKDAQQGEIQMTPSTRRSFSRGRGNVFLVTPGSRQVVWSTYLKMEDRSPQAMHRAARDIVKALKKDLEGKSKD